MSRFRSSTRSPVKPSTATVAPILSPVLPRPPAPRATGTAPPPPAVKTVDNTSVRRIAFYIGLAYIFVRFSMLHEVISVAYGITTYLPLIFGAPALLGVLLTGGVGRVLRVRTSYYFLAMAIWLMITVPFSSWKGGSTGMVSGYMKTELPIMFIAGGMAVTWQELKWVFYAIGLAGVVNEITARFMSTQDDRLQLEISSIGNANDFAAHLLFLIPIFWFIASNKEAPRVFRLLMIPLIPFGIYLSTRTASRGALLALGVTALVLFIRASGRQRLAVGLAVPAVAVAMFFMLPPNVLERYSTLLGHEEEAAPGAESEAEMSTAARTNLLRRGVELTLQNPIFGAGPGMFTIYEGDDAKAKGIATTHQTAHNSYTLLSSEAGIPALIFLLAALTSSYLNVTSIQRKARARGLLSMERGAFALSLSMIAFCVAAFFLSLTYRMYFPALVGLAIGMMGVAKRELDPEPANEALTNGK